MARLPATVRSVLQTRAEKLRGDMADKETELRKAKKQVADLENQLADLKKDSDEINQFLIASNG